MGMVPSIRAMNNQPTASRLQQPPSLVRVASDELLLLGQELADYFKDHIPTGNQAVLIECGFVSNSSERAGMITGLFRERLAVGIVKGIIAAKKDR